jgi:hypothetical protein
MKVNQTIKKQEKKRTANSNIPYDNMKENQIASTIFQQLRKSLKEKDCFNNSHDHKLIDSLNYVVVVAYAKPMSFTKRLEKWATDQTHHTFSFEMYMMKYNTEKLKKFHSLFKNSFLKKQGYVDYFCMGYKLNSPEAKNFEPFFDSQGDCSVLSFQRSFIEKKQGPVKIGIIN